MRRTSVPFTQLAIAVALSVGCTTYDPLFCDETHECRDPDRPFCDLAGEYPASDGVARTCIPDPLAGSDAGATDAGSDAGTDSGIDAGQFSYPQPEVYWALDEQDLSGATLTAREGGLSGILMGTALAPDAIAGEGLVLDGGDDRVDFGDSLDDVVAGADQQFSIALWIKPASVTGSQMILVKAGASNCEPPEQTRQFALVLTGGVPNFRYWTAANTSARFVGSTTPLVLDVWQHLLVTYDGSTDLGPVERVRIYVDGVPQPLEVLATLGDFPYDIEATDAHLGIGKVLSSSGGTCGTEQLNATLDELAIWSTVLAQENAREVYERGLASLQLWPL